MVVTRKLHYIDIISYLTKNTLRSTPAWYFDVIIETFPRRMVNTIVYHHLLVDAASREPLERETGTFTLWL